MGWRDREYTQGDASGLGAHLPPISRPPTVTLTLMIVHGAAFLLLAILRKAHPTGMEQWEFVSDAFLHPAGILLHPLNTHRFFSALFVVLALWSLAGRVEHALGGRRMLFRYVVGCIAAGMTAFAWGQAFQGGWVAELDTPVGGLATLLLAVTRHLRFESISVLGSIMPLARVYWIAAGIVVLLRVLTTGAAAVPWTLAIGAGLLIGWNIEQLAGRRPTLGGSRPRRASQPPMPKQRSAPPEPDIDDLLEKISARGIDALTDEERERLEAARRAKLRGRR